MAEPMQQILADFGRGLGLDALAFDDNGYCCMAFDDIVVNLALVTEATELMCYAQVALAPRPAGAEWYEALLAANHFFRGTGGATLGMDPATRSVVLARAVPVDGLSLSRFESMLQDFVDLADHWTRALAAPAAASAPAAADAGMAPFFGGLRA